MDSTPKERIFALGSLKVGDKFKYNNKVYMIVNMVKELTDIGDGCLVNKIQSYNCINIDRSSDILKIDKSNLNMMVEVVGI